MNIYAIVVTFNALKWIDKCFGSLLNSTIPLNVISIDNASNDGTPEIIKEKYPMVDVIRSDQNIGFGRANNIGLKNAYEAGADYVFLLNQDAWVESDTIEKLINASELHPEFGILSPLHLDGNGTSIDYGFSNYIHRDSNHNFVSDLALKGVNGLHNIYQIDFVNAAFWLMPRKTIETVGGFNPFFFLYGEDREYVNRCHYFRLKCGYVPSAKGYHGRIQKDSPEKERILKRTILMVRLFDPSDQQQVGKYINGLILSLLKSILLLKINLAKSIYLEIEYFSRHKEEIKKKASMVQTKGLTFLKTND